MQVIAALGLIGLGALFLVLDRGLSYPGLGAIGGMLIALVGLRIEKAGLTRQTDVVQTVELGEIPAGLIIGIVGVIVIISSLDKYRRAFA